MLWGDLSEPVILGFSQNEHCSLVHINFLYSCFLHVLVLPPSNVEMKPNGISYPLIILETGIKCLSSSLVLLWLSVCSGIGKRGDTFSHQMFKKLFPQEHIFPIDITSPSKSKYNITPKASVLCGVNGLDCWQIDCKFLDSGSQGRLGRKKVVFPAETSSF